MKILFYLIVYSVLGFVLERIINLVAWGIWYDNSVLIGPYQPMYGLGIVFTLQVWLFLKRFKVSLALKYSLLIVSAIMITSVTEYVSGSLYEYFYNDVLWDYRLTFTFCQGPYTCWFPTMLFGFLATFTVLYVHPMLDSFMLVIPKWVKYIIVLVFLLDVIYTYYEVFL